MKKKAMTFDDAIEILARTLMDAGVDPREAVDQAELQLFCEYCVGHGVEPKVVPVVEVQLLNACQAYFICSKCGRKNIHGWPEGGVRGGHRWGHCQCWPRGYFLFLKKGNKNLKKQ